MREKETHASLPNVLNSQSQRNMKLNFHIVIFDTCTGLNTETEREREEEKDM